ncbi:restriction endonuclease subunit S [Polaribacter sp. Hel_I_88]|uniref:restriction endonuclease subunit S n=1 Tax=Polaribacter sp. Hel_I_88 TaxID=1250006 RepID=UPI00068B4C33|nr:restriction endonuclease subunit S [Polaribacter sp. Hel_I_88]
MQLLKHFKELTIRPKNAKELKGLILQLAIQGKLTANWREENKDIEPAFELLKKIKIEKENLIKEKKIKKEKLLSKVKKEELITNLPNNWETVRLGEIGDWGAGSTPLRSNSSFYGGKINWFKSGELNNSVMDYESKEKITELALEKTSVRLNNPGDVLIAMYGATIGKTGILKVKGTTNQAVCACTPFSCITSLFLHLLLKGLKDTFINQGEGGAQPNISRVKIRTQVFGLPPLEEQKEIVKVVETLFKEVAQLEQLTVERIGLKEDFVTSALHQLTANKANQEWTFLQDHFKSFFNETTNIKKLRETVLQLAVQGKLTADWRANNPNTEDASQLLKRIQEEKAQLIADKKIKKEKALPPITKDEIPYELPEGWVWCRLGTVTDIIAGASFKSGDFNKKGGVKCIKITNAGVRNFVETDDYLPDGFNELHPNYLIKKGDLILALTRPYIKDGLKISICPSAYNNSLLNQRVASIRSMTKEIYHPYIFSFIQSPKVLNYYKSKFDGKSQQPNMKMGDITDLLISLPPLEEQKTIVEKVNALMCLCDALAQEVEQSQEHSEMMMQSVLREVFEGVI